MLPTLSCYRVNRLIEKKKHPHFLSANPVINIREFINEEVI